MFSRLLRTFSPRAVQPLGRNFSTSLASRFDTPSIPGTPTPKPTDAVRAIERERVQQLLKTSSFRKGPGPEFENTQYSRKMYPQKAYHPGELNEANARRSLDFRLKKQKHQDPFVMLGVNPLVEYKNTVLLSHFVTDMGRIKPRYQTGLSAKMQRRVGQAIRRARSFGLIPVTSRFDHGAGNRIMARTR
ncbi:hypothetical protein IW136_003178 [Coemansia sp. RSA 678]|nr:hypothetical protein IW136_003178 [Coemansia sp. RSA 678]